MLIKEECLQLIANHRTDEVVVTTMGTTVPWGKISTHPLDYASVGSAMGHAADFALGIALAKPDKKVIVLNGDGSMLMCLGTLATITALNTPPLNYLLSSLTTAPTKSPAINGTRWQCRFQLDHNCERCRF